MRNGFKMETAKDMDSELGREMVGISVSDIIAMIKGEKERDEKTK